MSPRRRSIAALCTFLLPSVLADFVFIPHSSPIRNTLLDPAVCRSSRDGVSTSSFPLTHPPTCYQIPVPDAQTGIQMQDFCVYTNSLFGYGRGVTLITSPEVLSRMTAEPYYDEESRVDEEEDRGRRYEAMDTEERGIGLIATKDIVAGDVYMTRTPILLVAQGALSGDSRKIRQAMLRKAISQLPSKTQELFMGLTKSRGGDVVNDILQTNSVRMLFEEVPHLGVVPEAARINHACRQNSYYRFSDNALTLSVFALRNITTASELSFSYGFSNLPQSERRAAIKETWFFDCTCALCTAPAEDIQASDARLARIKEIKENLPDEPGRAPELISWLPEIIELLDLEGIVTERPQFEEILAYSWAAFGHEERAMQWARRARMGWEIVAGKGSNEAGRCGVLEQWPKKHPSWEMWKDILLEEDHKVDYDGFAHEHGHDHHHDHHHHHH